MDDFAQTAFREREARQVLRRRSFLVHLAVFLAVNAMLVGVWALAGGGYPWFLFALMGWGIGLVAHGASVYLLARPDDVVLEREQRRGAQDRPGP